MKPILFEIFGLPVASWYLFFALAGTSAYFLSRQLLIILNDRGDSISSEIQHHGILFSSGYVAGWFGARGMSIVREDFASQEFGNSLSSLFQLGSMTFYGGVVCATAVGIGLVFFYKLNLTKCLAAFVPAGVLALGIGRIGCFLNGDDFGKPLSDPKANPWWAHTTPWMEDQVLRYPTQLQEALFSIVLATLSYLTIKKQMKSPKFASKISLASIISIVILLTAGNRFVNEFYRGDPRGSFWYSTLSTSQGIALILMCLALCHLIQRLYVNVFRPI